MIGAGVGEQGASRQPWSSGFPAGTGRHLQAPPHLLQAFERVPRAGLGNARLRASGSVFGPVALPDRGPASMLQLHLLLQGCILRQGEEPWVLLVNLPSVFKSSGQADLSCSGGSLGSKQTTPPAQLSHIWCLPCYCTEWETHTHPCLPRLWGEVT